MTIHLYIIGCCLVALGLAHVIFPSYFNWKQELSSLSIMNREMMYVHTFFIAFAILLIGVLCLTSSTELIDTPLGRRISLGLGIFWSVRLYVQFFGYSSTTWKGKPLETAIHILFSIFWAYLSGIFIMIFFGVG